MTREALRRGNELHKEIEKLKQIDTNIITVGGEYVVPFAVKTGRLLEDLINTSAYKEIASLIKDSINCEITLLEKEFAEL